METTNHIAYDIDKSSQRMDQILSVSNDNFSDSDSIPPWIGTREAGQPL